MRALDRKLWRDLWRIRGQALAIALVMGCGLAVFVMMLGMIDSLEETRTAYYERYRFADVFASLERAPERLAGRIGQIPGVQVVSTRIVESVVLDVPGLDEPATGRLISLPERARPALNDLVVRMGRRPSPGHPEEVVASEPFAEAHGLLPGDHLSAIIHGRKRRLQIVGIALSPEYVYSIAPGGLMPDDLRYGVFWMGRDALAAAFDFEGAFNDVSLMLRRDAAIDEVIARLDLLLEPHGGLGAYGRADQLSNWFLSSEIEGLRTMVGVMPTIFLGVAAFLLNLVVNRLIAIEREQIGLLKAFGYGDLAIGWHYLKLVLAMASLGLMLGLIAGSWLGRMITEVFTETYRLPFLYHRPSPSTYAAAVLVSVGAAMLGTLGAVRRAVVLPPAVAMQPAPPPLYRRHGAGAAKWLDQPSRMIVRHVVRWPARSALTSLGIALSVAVLATSLQWLDAIEHMVEVHYFEVERQDATVTLVAPRERAVLEALGRLPGVLAVEPYRSVAARLRHGHLERREAIVGLAPDARLARVLDASGQPIALPPEGLVLSRTLADLLAVRPGDRIMVEVLEGHRPRQEIAIARVFDAYLGTPAHMDIRALNRLMLEGPAVSGAHLLTDSAREAVLYQELKETPAVAGVALRRAAIDTFRETLDESVGFVIAFYVAFAGLLAFGVVYNSTRISLSERGRELASLRVLGFTQGEVAYILLGELAVLTLFALPLGCLIGYGLSMAIGETLDTELYRIPVVLERRTFAVAILVAITAVVASAILIRRRLDRLDLIAVLKTRE